ncbi:MAG: porin family protein [Prevotellaceae bacterium]|jgi:hypothetical protein|nr:porin family protein [Prevotellaceae bacterium]
MKKLFMIAAMMVATLSVSAQQAGQMFIKPMVGGTVSTVVGDIDDTKAKIGLVGGAEFGYNINETFGITAGVLYTMQGYKIKGVDDAYNLDYINVPVLANVYVAPGLALKAGPQIGFMTRAKCGDVDFKDIHKTVDFSIPVGASYEISDFVIDFRYNIGVTNIFKNDGDDDGSVRNSVVMLTVGYKIPF